MQSSMTTKDTLAREKESSYQFPLKNKIITGQIVEWQGGVKELSGETDHARKNAKVPTNQARLASAKSRTCLFTELC